jgi:hypothetical protein
MAELGWSKTHKSRDKFILIILVINGLLEALMIKEQFIMSNSSTSTLGLFDIIGKAKGTGVNIDKESFLSLINEHTERLGESPIQTVGEIHMTRGSADMFAKAAELKSKVAEAEDIIELTDAEKKKMLDRIKTCIEIGFRAEGKNAKLTVRLDDLFAQELINANGPLSPKSDPNNVLAIIIKTLLTDEINAEINKLNLGNKGVTVVVLTNLKAKRGAAASGESAIQYTEI